MNTSSDAPKISANNKSRWFFLMNLVIAIVIVSAVVLLKDSASHYKSAATFNGPYIAATETETDPAVLQHGIVHTEAARAHAYRSILKQSNGTFIVGLLVAFAFVANSIYIFRLTRNQSMGNAAAA